MKKCNEETMKQKGTLIVHTISHMAQAHAVFGTRKQSEFHMSATHDIIIRYDMGGRTLIFFLRAD